MGVESVGAAVGATSAATAVGAIAVVVFGSYSENRSWVYENSMDDLYYLEIESCCLETADNIHPAVLSVLARNTESPCY